MNHNIEPTLILRPVTPGDISLITSWWNDGATMASVGFPLGLGINNEEVEQQLKNYSEDSEFLIIQLNQVAIGEFTYRKVAEDTVAIGMKIGEEEYRGQGWGEKTLRIGIEYLFEQKDIQRIVLDVNAENIAAKNLYEKVGFQETGFHYHSWENQLGDWMSAHDYELKRCDKNR